MATGKVRALMLLDLYAAFDTIDYSVLLDCCSNWYGISGIPHTWICSFLINRFQSIKIRNCFSKAIPLFCGIPEGSVYGSLLFTLCSIPLSSLIHTYKLDRNLCANDSQVYWSLSTADMDLSLKGTVHPQKIFLKFVMISNQKFHNNNHKIYLIS